MILVAVCDDNAPYFIFLIHKVIDVRDYQVNAEHFLSGKHEANINN